MFFDTPLLEEQQQQQQQKWLGSQNVKLTYPPLRPHGENVQILRLLYFIKKFPLQFYSQLSFPYSEENDSPYTYALKEAGMKSAKQIHIQSLASCIGEMKLFEY